MSTENNPVKHLFSLFVRFAFMSFMFTGVEAFLLELKSFPSDFLCLFFLSHFHNTTIKTKTFADVISAAEKIKTIVCLWKVLFFCTQHYVVFHGKFPNWTKERRWKVFNLYSIFTMFKLFNFIICPSTMALLKVYRILFYLMFSWGWLKVVSF